MRGKLSRAAGEPPGQAGEKGSEQPQKGVGIGRESLTPGLRQTYPTDHKEARLTTRGGPGIRFGDLRTCFDIESPNAMLDPARPFAEKTYRLRRVYVFCDSINGPARVFYEAHGFELACTVPGFYHYCDAAFYVLDVEARSEARS